MRNKKGSTQAFFYFGEGKGAYVDFPKTNLTKNVYGALPSGVQAIVEKGMTEEFIHLSRVRQYLIDQPKQWPNVLYLFDEWNAYITNAKAALEMIEAKTYTYGPTDEVDGAMDFLYFCNVAMVVTQQSEPTYLQNKQFKAIYALMMEETMQVVRAGLKVPEFRNFHANALMQHFISDPANEKSRQLLKQMYGADWTKKVFGF
jgi:hypothetical protein